MSQLPPRTVIADLDTAAQDQGGKGHLRRAWERLLRKKLAMFSVVVLIVLYSVGIFAPLLAPYEYTAQDYTAIRKPPSAEHWPVQTSRAATC